MTILPKQSWVADISVSSIVPSIDIPRLETLVCLVGAETWVRRTIIRCELFLI